MVSKLKASLGLALIFLIQPAILCLSNSSEQTFGLNQLMANQDQSNLLLEDIGFSETNDSPIEWPTEDWLNSTPEEQGMNSTKLELMMSYIEEQMFAIDSLLVIRNGRIVLEEYPGFFYKQDSLHQLYSVTKSFTSTLIGIAIDKGFIDSVDQKVVDFFPNKTFQNLDSRKKNMTLEHLLTMTAGLSWDEWSLPYSASENDYRQMMSSEDPAQFLLDRPMLHTPGTSWTYNSGASHLLSIILEKGTGVNALSFAMSYLFCPLGISKVMWGNDMQGHSYGGHALSLLSRDMAKVGFLYLNNGTWDGEQVVSTEWTAKATLNLFTPFSGVGYGYQIWSYPDEGIFYFSGLYGQAIFVVPAYDMVIIFTASLQNHNPETDLLFQYIIPAALDPVLQTTTNPFPTNTSILSTTTSTGTPSVSLYPISLLIALVVAYWMTKTRRK